MPKAPLQGLERGLRCCSPDGIRTRATALRGRRARPLHNGAIRPATASATSRAGVPGLEPRLAEPESAGLPITPYPMGASRFRPDHAEDATRPTSTYANHSPWEDHATSPVDAGVRRNVWTCPASSWRTIFPPTSSPRAPPLSAASPVTRRAPMRLLSRSRLRASGVGLAAAVLTASAGAGLVAAAP